MILVFPQATQKFNHFYNEIRISRNGLEVYAEKISNIYDKKNIKEILFIVLDSFAYQEELKDSFANCFSTIPINFLLLKNETHGAMCTLLMAVNQLKDLPIVVSSLDQILLDSSSELIFNEDKATNAVVPVFNSNESIFSYLLRDDKAQPIQVFEKKVISDEAIMGIYFIKNFTDFFDFSIELIVKYKGFRERVFFISDVLNAYLRASKSIDFPVLITNKYYKFKSLKEYEAILNNEKD